MAACSFSETKCATPLRQLWISGPPRVAAVTSSPVTDLITSGPVRNMKLVSLVMMTKSVSAGE